MDTSASGVQPWSKALIAGWILFAGSCGPESPESEDASTSFMPTGGSGESTNVGSVSTETTLSSDGDDSSASSASSSGGTEGDSESANDTAKPLNCEDGYACVASPPINWLGPVVRVESMTAEVLAACGGSFPLKESDVFLDPEFEPATCSLCHCGAPSGMACSEVAIDSYEQLDCLDPPSASGTVGPDDGCKNFIVSSDAGLSWQSDKVKVDFSMASCPASGGFPSVGEVNWNQSQRLCAPVANNRQCPPEKTCIPTGVGTAKPGLCIYRSGDESCPSDIYPDRSVFFANYVDQRDCSACGCGQADGDYVCNAGIVGYSGVDCGGARSDSIVDPGKSCEELNLSGETAKSGRLVVQSIEGEGTCSISGGEPIGQVSPSEAVTICCTL